MRTLLEDVPYLLMAITFDRSARVSTTFQSNSGIVALKHDDRPWQANEHTSYIGKGALFSTSSSQKRPSRSSKAPSMTYHSDYATSFSHAGMEEPANLADAYSCFGFDIITSLCYGQEKGLLTSREKHWSGRRRARCYSTNYHHHHCSTLYSTPARTKSRAIGSAAHMDPTAGVRGRWTGVLITFDI